MFRNTEASRRKESRYAHPEEKRERKINSQGLRKACKRNDGRKQAMRDKRGRVLGNRVRAPSQGKEVTKEFNGQE